MARENERHPSAADDTSLAGALNLSGGVIALVIFVFFAFRARFTVPYIDDWRLLASAQDHPFTRGLWQLHNEHFIPIPRLVLWLGYWTWGWPEYATLIAALASHLAIAAVLVTAAYRDRPKTEARLVSGSILVLLFLTYNLQGVVFPGVVAFPLVAVFSVLAFECLSRSIAEHHRQNHGTRLAALSAIMSVLAMLCLTNGVIVPFVLMALAWLQRQPRNRLVGFGLLGAVAVLARWHFGLPSATFVAPPLAILRFGLAMLAGPVASISPAVAVTIGTAFVGMAIWTLWQIHHRDTTGTSTLIGGNLCFVMASAAIAAVARAQIDLSVAAESRYSVLVLIGWASLLLAIPCGISRRSRMPAVALLTLTIFALPLQMFVGRVWAAKADHLDVASLVLNVGVNDVDWIWGIDPNGLSDIEPVIPQLRARRVKFLDFPDHTRAVLTPPSLGTCSGEVQIVNPGVGSDGFRVEASLRDSGTQLRIRDRELRVCGLARPAPVVLHGRATPNDFVWAEIENLLARSVSDVNWLGFGEWGSGPPYTADLLGPAGQAVCQIPANCCSPPALTPARRELVVRGGLAEGWLDIAGCAVISGWAYDQLRPNEPLEIRIETSRGTSLTTVASEFRRDLADAGKGDGRHGFVVPVARLGLGAGSWRIAASFATNGLPLNGSPKAATCGTNR
jgi:hypothetical protein